jgi:transcriptional regulator with XRE-family HTH domain
VTSGPILSTVHGIELGRRLRAHREALRLTTTAVGRATGLGGNNVSSLENFRRRLTPVNLARLTSHYELPPHEVAELARLRDSADQRQWWHEYDRLFGDDFIRFIGLEAGASVVREYQAEAVPGLLQTPDYARAMISGGTTYIRPVEVGRRVEARLARQARLVEPSPIDYRVVVGPAALRLEVGGRAVMRRQLDHLVEVVSSHPHVRLRALPWSIGAHSMINSAVKIMRFSSRWVPDHLWLDNMATAGTLTDDRETALELTAGFDEVFDRALDRDATLAMISGVRKEMGMP